MTIRQYLSTRKSVFAPNSFVLVPIRYVVAFKLPKSVYEQRDMTPCNKQIVHGFSDRKSACYHAKHIKDLGGYSVKVVPVGQHI